MEVSQPIMEECEPDKYAEHGSLASIRALESTVQAAGLKASAADLLDMGSDGYSKVPKEIRGLAFTILKSRGWTEDGIRGVIKNLMGKRHEKMFEDAIYFILEESAKTAPEIK